MISSENFDACQIHTTGKKASGKSLNKVNINPYLGKYLTLIHRSLVRPRGYGMKIKMYDNVRKEIHRKSSTDLTTGAITRWG